MLPQTKAAIKAFEKVCMFEYLLDEVRKDLAEKSEKVLASEGQLYVDETEKIQKYWSETT